MNRILFCLLILLSYSPTIFFSFFTIWLEPRLTVAFYTENLFCLFMFFFFFFSQLFQLIPPPPKKNSCNIILYINYHFSLVLLMRFNRSIKKKKSAKENLFLYFLLFYARMIQGFVLNASSHFVYLKSVAHRSWCC